MRAFFWRFKDAFIGQGFLIQQPKYLAYYPVIVFGPIYAFYKLQAENVYYDEYDGEMEEKMLKQ